MNSKTYEGLDDILGVSEHSKEKYPGLNRVLGISETARSTPLTRSDVYRGVIALGHGNTLRQYCTEQRIELPILRPVSGDELLRLCYQIIEASIKLRRELDIAKDLLRSAYVQSIGVDTLNPAQLRRWEEVTADHANYFAGEDPYVSSIPPVSDL